MKRHANNTNALLVEIMLAVLFFSLCASMLLQGFTAIHNKSDASAAEIRAMVRARNVLEQLNASDDPDALLDELGFKPVTGETQSEWLLQTDDGPQTVLLSRESSAGGTIIHISLTAEDRSGTPLFTLRGGHYVVREVTE